MRFLTITCNAAVDTTYLIDHLHLGAINRIAQVLPTPGGKGNNVARVLAALGQRPIASGFVGGCAGQIIQDGLRTAGVETSFVTADGESRVCLTVVETDRQRISEVREPGMSISPDDGKRLIAHVRALAAAVDVAIIAGSLPPGLDSHFYSRLIEALKEGDVYVVLDSSGDALRHGLSAGPHLIKPNRDEVAALVGPGSPEELIERTRTGILGSLLPADASVLLSLGDRGAALIRHDGAWLAHAPEIEIVNTVGSGDALLAGYLNTWAAKQPPAQALAQAVAVGSAAALQLGVGLIDLHDVDRLRVAVRVEEAQRSAINGFDKPECADEQPSIDHGRHNR